MNNLVIEDGSGKSDAQSYIDATDAADYHTGFGNTKWAERPDLQEQCLVKATQMADIVWGSKYLSRKGTKQQRLLFPRLGFYDNNGDYVANDEIPNRLKDAVCELALLFMDDPNLLAVSDTTGIKRKTQKVGDLEETVEYNGQYSTADKFSKVSMLLQPILSGPDFGIRL